MIRHFALSSEPSGAIAKRLRHAKNQLYIYIYREREREINRVLIVRIQTGLTWYRVKIEWTVQVV